jgi:hypothetical protein
MSHSDSMACFREAACADDQETPDDVLAREPFWLKRETARQMLRSCEAYHRKQPLWRGRSMLVAWTLNHLWDERDQLLEQGRENARIFVEELTAAQRNYADDTRRLREACRELLIEWDTPDELQNAVWAERCSALIDELRRVLATTTEPLK